MPHVLHYDAILEQIPQIATLGTRHFSRRSRQAAFLAVMSAGTYLQGVPSPALQELRTIQADRR